MAKLQRGEKPTPAELDTMKKWAESMKGGAKGGPAGSGPAAGAPPAGWSATSARPTLDELGVCPAKRIALATATPSATEYKRLVADVAARYRKKLGPIAGKLDRDLERAKTADQLTLASGAALTKGSGSGAIYVAARAAEMHPSDALSANNLGALLVGAGALAEAQRVLAVADKLAPDMPLVAVNRGWVLYTARDPGAKAMFERALRLAPDMPSAQLGLGLLAACAKDPEKAAPALRAAAQRPTPIAQLALEAIAPADPGAYAGKTKLVLPPPQITSWDNVASDARNAGVVHQQILAVRTGWTVAITRRNEVIQKLWNEGRHAQGLESQRYEAIKEPYSKAITAKTKPFTKALLDLYMVFHKWNLEGINTVLQQRAACRGNSQCEQQVDYQRCLDGKRLAVDLYGKYAVLAHRSWRETEPLIEDLWSHASGMIEKFNDPAWAEQRRLDLEAEIALHYGAFVDPTFSFTGIMKVAHEMKCVPPPPPPSGQAPTAKVPGLDAGKCPLPAFKVGIEGVSWASFQVHCFKLQVNLQSPSGYMGYLKWDALGNETTVFAGIGGGNGALGIRGGVFVDFVGTEVKGLGLEGKASAELLGYGSTGTLRIDALALQAGPPVDGEAAKKFISWGTSQSMKVN